MNAEIICIGSEILLGDIINTNSQFLSENLTSFGINVFFHTCVGDNENRLAETLKIALNRSNLIFITGGLGPTCDDITKQVIAKTLKINLIENSQLKNTIISKFKEKNIAMPLNNLKQAQIFENSKIFTNEIGTAPGLALTYKNKTTIIVLPGPPNELIPMFKNEVEPFLQKLKQNIIKSKNVYLYGIAESEVDEKIENILKLKNPSVGIYAKPGEIRLRVSCKAKNEKICNDEIEKIVNKIKSKLKNNIVGIDIKSMENALVKTAIENNQTISVAESCTGGNIAAKIVSIKNASKCFKLAAVCYNNEMKQKILGVDPKILNEFGAVSAQVAQQMAQNVRIIANSSIGISTTGIVGPGGEESKTKPIGLVFVGLSTKEKTMAFKLMFKNNKSRTKLIHLTSLFAMNSARKLAENLK